MVNLRTTPLLSDDPLKYDKTNEFVFPDKPDYENPMVAVEQNYLGYFNFIFKDGQRSSQEFVQQAPSEVREIPQDRPVRRIDFYTHQMSGLGERLNCFMLYDKIA